MFRKAYVEIASYSESFYQNRCHLITPLIKRIHTALIYCLLVVYLSFVKRRQAVHHKTFFQTIDKALSMPGSLTWNFGYKWSVLIMLLRKILKSKMFNFSQSTKRKLFFTGLYYILRVEYVDNLF